MKGKSRVTIKKYEFTEETKVFCGRKLHRIRALRDFNDVKAGDLGGFIEKEENLSHEGNCWIYNNAKICGCARIYGNAVIFGNAVIYGNAEIYNGKWDKSPLYIQGTKWAFYVSSENTITIGCQIHTFEEWQKNYKQIAEKHDGLEVLTEYIRYFNLACEMYGKEEYKIDLKEEAA